jgi:hypothetical protein
MSILVHNNKSANLDDSLIPMLFSEFADDQKFEEGSTLADAMAALKRNDKETAIHELSHAVDSPDSRIQIVAWKQLKKLSIYPDAATAKKVLGTVVEVGLADGTDYLAVYSDNSARYFNFSGKKIFWEPAKHDINLDFQKLMQYSQAIVDLIGVWEEPRRPAPKQGFVRLNFLTPMGLHFVEGSFSESHEEPLAQQVLAQAAGIMKKLIARASGKSNDTYCARWLASFMLYTLNSFFSLS